MQYLLNCAILGSKYLFSLNPMKETILVVEDNVLLAEMYTYKLKLE